MKQVLLSLSILCAVGADAQAISHGKWEENSHSRPHKSAAEPNEFTGTEIAVENRVVTFTDLPEVSHPVWAIITDANGEQQMQKRVSALENSMDLHRLHKGEMYFLTLMYKDKSKKAFVVHL